MWVDGREYISSHIFCSSSSSPSLPPCFVAKGHFPQTGGDVDVKREKGFHLQSHQKVGEAVVGKSLGLFSPLCSAYGEIDTG